MCHLLFYRTSYRLNNNTYMYINANPSIFTERNDQRGNQQHSRELLMMGIAVPETG